MLDNLLIAITHHKIKTKLSQAKIGLQAGIIESRLCNIVKGKVEATPKERKALSRVLKVDEAILFAENEKLAVSR